MITEITMYEAQCDRCKDIFFYDPHDDSTSTFVSREGLINTIKLFGWKNINGKWYCRECAKEVEKGGER